ncbi:MAG: DUF2284 domain-containing protein [Firmicutes bacterium]|nr:DUF2284 domain-containing protein [Bacillota bacterium]
MTDKEMLDCAFRQGFANAALVQTSRIVFDPSFRPYCEENLCGQYGVNYSCPPSCGSPEEMKQRILAHDRAMMLQTIWQIDDYNDAPAIKSAKGSHNRAALALAKELRAQGQGGFLVGASGCALCSPCELSAGKPCRFPDLRYSCMSAYCIFVRKLAEECGIEYDCGDGLLAFFGMYVLD